MRDPEIDIEYIFVEPPPLFSIEDVVFKCTVARAHPHTDDDIANEIEHVLYEALFEYTSKRNMTIGYSAVTSSTRKDV